MTNKAQSTTLPARTTRDPAVGEADVLDYLEAHPEFFEAHATFVSTLKLPHLRGDGHAVSLVERQIEVLRSRAREHELKLRELLEIGHANDALAEKMHRLARGLIHARDAGTRFLVIERSLRDDFAADDFVVLLHDRAIAEAVAGSIGGQREARRLRFADRQDEGMRAFDSLYASSKPRCGQVRDSSREYLFPDAATAVGSVALVPLGPGGDRGLLAIASPDVHRFNPTMSTDYLARIGDLIATALH